MCNSWRQISLGHSHSHVNPEVDLWNRHVQGNHEWEMDEPELSELLAPYTLEDAWLDQLASLPSEEQLEKLFDIMRAAEIREYAQGLTKDAVEACKDRNVLAVAENINGWIATAEEVANNRRKLRFIQAARSRR